MSKKCTTNKFGVPSHRYQIHLVNHTDKWIDIADESDWGDVQPMTNSYGEWFAEGKDVIPNDWNARVGFGNDADGHIEIDDVIDLETYEHLNPREWAEKAVWKYTDNYAA